MDKSHYDEHDWEWEQACLQGGAIEIRIMNRVQGGRQDEATTLFSYEAVMRWVREHKPRPGEQWTILWPVVIS